MNVNDFFTQVGDFWRGISIPILFHLIFLTLYSYLFGHVRFKARLEQYIKSESFARTKALLTEFELWKKLPYILLIAALVYLSVFNNVSEVIANSLPLDFSYSNSDFFQEYQEPEDLIKIAKYGRSERLYLSDLDDLLVRLLEEYKAKYPENYKLGIEYWGSTEFGKRRSLLDMSYLTLIAVIAIFPSRLQRKKTTIPKAHMLARLLCLLIVAAPVLFILRYRAEQALEEQFVLKVKFVRSSLEADSSKHITYTAQDLQSLTKDLKKDLNSPPYAHEFVWVSRIVGSSKPLEFFMGRRVLKSITIVQAQPYSRSRP